MGPDPDVVVIGAGAAGLACASELGSAGLRVLCLEGRDRIGGRIHTVHDVRAAIPIELGAEFVHGRPREIFDLAESAALPVEESGGRMLYVAGGGHAEAPGGWGVLEDMRRSASLECDESFQSFLDRSQYHQDEKQAASGFVEGFNAARKEEVSVASLAKDMAAADEIDGDRSFRLCEGYDTVARALAGTPDAVRLCSVVEMVAWHTGGCRIRLATGEEYVSTRVVITVPLGVLQAGAIRFDPEPEGIFEAVRALRVGQAVRVTFRFERAFWEDAPRFAGAGFLLSAEPVFPTWWSVLPWREPVLTGWSAGPKADPLARLAEPEVIARAIESLRRVVGREPAAVTGAWFHDWRADPFARGAYSWVPAGALPARDVLARPVAETLYFAGEHTDLAGYGGTVHGAIASGRRAARQILDAAGVRLTSDSPSAMPR